jgi:signal transduction histidine kinase
MQPFPVQDDPIFSQWVHDGRTEPELIVDTRLDPRWPQLGSRNVAFIEAIRCYLGAPLILDGDLVGVLCLANRAPNSFDALAVDAAAEFAERLARALRNARLYEMERTANARLQRLIRLQDDFVATVSHELRTPLTSILGFAENLTLFWEMMGDAQRRASVDKIQRAGARLDRLIRDLLQLARSDPDTLRLLPKRIVLAPLVAHAVDEIAGKYPGQIVTLSPGMHDAACWADADRVSQILINLLDNAAKYSPDGSPVAVEWEQGGEWGILTVCDAGRGIHPEDVPGLFRRFGKLDATTRAGHVGTGLGLYICKQLAEAMGGHVWYEPIDPSSSGAGSRFRVQLPLHQPAQSPRDQPVPAT